MTSKICTLGIFTLVLVEILCSSTYANQDSIEIQESTSSCLENCQCRDSEIRCEGFPSDIHRIPEGVKRIVFQKAISCEEENLQRLHKLIVLTNIELIGQCNCPEHLAGHDLKDVNELRSNSLELHRHERSVNRRSIINSQYALSLDKTWNSTSGYVSVQYKGRTGVICESLWYLENADVICRQIGYIGAFSGAYGPGSPRSQATLIHDLSCNGYETVVDQCRISRSSYTCREIYVRGVSCNPGQTAADYDSRNRPDYCTFEKGFCGWSNQATPGFIHHPGDGRHYNPSYSYRNYIYAIRPRNSLIKVNAELISPPFERHSTSSSYVTYVYDVNGSRMNKLLISYRASYGSDTTIESKSFSSSTAGWSSGLSSSFRPNGVFTVKLTCRSDYSSSYIYSASISIRSIIVHNVKVTNVHLYSVNIPGVVIGSLVGVAAVIILTIYIYKRSHRRQVIQSTVPQRGGLPQYTQTNVNFISQAAANKVADPPSYANVTAQRAGDQPIYYTTNPAATQPVVINPQQQVYPPMTQINLANQQQVTLATQQVPPITQQQLTPTTRQH